MRTALPFCSLLASVFFLVSTTSLSAGTLLDIYCKSVESAPLGESARLEAEAASQAVVTEKRQRLPRLGIDFRELWVSRDIDRSSPIFRPGDESDYENRRANLELDQPLFDGTIKPEIEAAQARERQMSARTQWVQEDRTRLMVEKFITAVKFQSLIDSTDSVIGWIEGELDSVNRQKEANVATVSDVQNIRLSHVSLKRDRGNYEILRDEALSYLGTDKSCFRAVNTGWSHYGSKAEWLKTIEAEATPAEVAMLEAEAEEIAKQAEATRRRSWPVLSLYGHYGSDYGGSPEFGGFRTEYQDLNYYEAGVVVRWNLFDRGMNQSEARELELKSRAREAELEHRVSERERVTSLNSELLGHVSRNLDEIAALKDEYKVLEDAAQKSWKAGQGTYGNWVSARLSREAAHRDWVLARHDLLARRIALHASVAGWNRELVENIDHMFLASK